MKGFLKLKHWQLFLLIVIPFAWTSPSPLKEMVNLIGTAFFSVWIYSIGVYGQEKLKENGLQLGKINFFKVNILLIPALIGLAIFLAPNKPAESIDELSMKTIIYFPIALYLMFASVYCIVFASRTIVTLELKKKVTFNDYGLTFLLFLILVAGIWVIQPKVKRLIANNDNTGIQQ